VGPAGRKNLYPGGRLTHFSGSASNFLFAEARCQKGYYQRAAIAERASLYNVRVGLAHLLQWERVEM
jgi:hypothetical protein